MEHCNKKNIMDSKSDNLVAEKTAATAFSEVGSAIETHLGRGKITVILTHKAFVEKCERLQNVRKDKLNKVKNLRKVTEEYMHEISVAEVKGALQKILVLCEEAKNAHDCLVPLMSAEESGKQNTWFAAKMLVENGFIDDVKQWLRNNENGGDVVDVHPDDSISNVASKRSHQKSVCSGKSSNKSGQTTTSARIKVEAEKAAILARSAALKGKHALEKQEAELRRQREQLELDAEIAASTAKLAVLQTASECSRKSQASNGMNSYLQRSKEQKTTSNGLNPAAKSYEPWTWSAMPQTNFPVCHKDSSAQNTHTVEKGQQHLLESRQDTHRKTTEPYGTTQYGATQHQTLYFPVNNEQPASVEQPHLHSAQMQGDLCTIMHKQNEITAALVQQQRLLSLPSRDIPVFDGDPLQYRNFIRAFEHGVESKANKADCLYFLEQFTKGQPRELVRSCQHIIPDRGYQLAKELLHEHFGNEYSIAAAYIEKALAWPTVKSEDVKSLQAFSLFLRGCCNVMEELHYMQELDMPTNMRAIMTKLPFKYREKWRTKAHEILERHNRRACFRDLVSFLERQVKIISDPLFGDIQDMTRCSPTLMGVNKFKSQPKFSRARGSSFATTVTVVDTAKGSCSNPQRQDSKERSEKACVYCFQSHTLEECPKLKRKKHRDKITFLKEKRMCFGCLCSGHMSKDCDRRLICKECGRNHPTVLHISERPRTNTENEHSKEKGYVKAPSSETCGHTGAGKEDSILSILPIQVKSIKGDKIIQTYAFLDPGSTATFCSEHLMQKLNIDGRITNFLLRTMGQEKVVFAHALNGLEVAGLDSNQFYSLPEVLTQRKMPVTTNNIVTQEELAKWPYLSDVRIPCIDANVDMLIGTNVPKVLEPWEVVNSQENGPYAVRTVLGWVVNGPLRDGENSKPKTRFSVAAVNRISVCKLEEMLNNQYNHDFNERSTEEKGMSREDIRFLKIMDESAQLQDGHYSMKMPFRKEQLTLPNNLSMVKQRLLGLKGKFRKDELFHQEYTNFFTDVIQKGYAEKVPQHQLDGENGKVWYIPHHGVRHPKKGTLRVVFDCSAEFKGASLNSQLLQGPNLTSSLLGVLVRFRQEPVAFMGDIQSMFYQVKVAEEDKDFLRFLWWPDGNVSTGIVEYRMSVHLFGAVSSPSCASYALRKTAEDNQAHFSSEVVKTVKQNFYVDDCLKSLPSEEESVVMVKALNDLCLKGGFTLTKWISNSRTVLQSIEEEHRAKDWKELDLDRDELPVERALGLQWCVESDTFKFKMMVKEQPQSRRGLLSIICSVYDPLGFLAPVTLPAKVILQELCRRRCGWDDNIPADISHQWTGWLEDLKGLSSFKVERCIKPKHFGQPIQAQLHNFSDEIGRAHV